MYDQYTPLATIMEVLADDQRPFAGRLRDEMARRGTLSHAQFGVAVRMANEHEARQKNKRTASLLELDFSKTFAALDKAEIRLGRFFAVGDTEVRVKRKRDGTAYFVTMGDDWVGAVTEDGRFIPNFKAAQALPMPLHVIAKGVADFGDDPRGHMMRYGHATGTCGMCGRPLSDPESVALGIGPICAGRLP